MDTVELDRRLPIHKAYCDVTTFTEMLSFKGFMTDEQASRLHLVTIENINVTLDGVPRKFGHALVASLEDIRTYLREHQGVCVEVYACAGGYVWELCKAYDVASFSGGTTIYVDFDQNDPKLNDCGKYDRYEVALNDGIIAAIKYLKEQKSE